MLVAFLTLTLHVHPACAGLKVDSIYSSSTSSPWASFSALMCLRYSPCAEGARQLSGTGIGAGAGAGAGTCRGIGMRRRVQCICMRNEKGEDGEMSNAMSNGVPRAAKRVRDCCCCCGDVVDR